jgi:hypothetical protein
MYKNLTSSLNTEMQGAKPLTPQKSARIVYRAVRDVMERNGVWPVIGHGNDGATANSKEYNPVVAMAVLLRHQNGFRDSPNLKQFI